MKNAFVTPHKGVLSSCRNGSLCNCNSLPGFPGAGGGGGGGAGLAVARAPGAPSSLESVLLLFGVQSLSYSSFANTLEARAAWLRHGSRGCPRSREVKDWAERLTNL